jgi:hypothetical protein
MEARVPDERYCRKIIWKSPTEIYHMFEWNKVISYMMLSNNYSSDFKKYKHVEYMYLKIYINMFFYSVTEVSV